MDLSDLDKQYFIDAYVYNCPFCKRGNVYYEIAEIFKFDWTESKECYCYLVKCQSKGCGKTSLHFSFRDLQKPYDREFRDNINIDDKIFYSRPSSFFTLDSRIPESIRQLIFESEQSRQANLLVGSSACLRKAIYQLLEHEKSIVRDEKTNRANYKQGIKNLKSKFSNVSPELFDALANIQEMASDFIHEGSWEAWDSPKLRFLIELVKAILDEMYVIPNERKSRLSLLGELKSKFVQDKKVKP